MSDGFHGRKIAGIPIKGRLFGYPQGNTRIAGVGNDAILDNPAIPESCADGPFFQLEMINPLRRMVPNVEPVDNNVF